MKDEWTSANVDQSNVYTILNDYFNMWGFLSLRSTY